MHIQSILLTAALALGACLPTTNHTRSTTTAIGATGSVSRAYLRAHNLPAHGVAIEGFSPVSYFDGKVERGSAMFAITHAGITYHLTDAAQVAEFQRDPERYLPQFGGWCAFGMSVSDKFPIDPTAYKIVDDRLFLFLRNDGIDALDLWNKGKESELLTKARAHWRKVQG